MIRIGDLFENLTDIERLFMNPKAAPWRSLGRMRAFMEACAEDKTKWPKSMPCCIHATRGLPTKTQSVFSEKPLACRGGWGLEVDESVVIHGPLFIGRNVKIRKGAAIIGPAVIGDNVIIGNSRVKHSIVREGAIVQSYVRLRNAIIGKGSRLFPNVCVNDERIRGCEVEFYDGMKMISTGMKQFGLIAGDDVFIGGACVTYPGAIVASGARVEHGTMLFPKLYEGHITNPAYDAFMRECGR